MHLFKSLHQTSMMRLLAVGVASATLVACSQTEIKQKHFEKVGFNQIPAWHKDDLSGTAEAFLNSCKSFKYKKAEEALSSNHSIFSTYQTWQNLCTQAVSIPKGQFKSFIEKNFDPYQVVSKEGSLFTGYYAPHLKGSKTPKKGYETPLYNYPDNIYTVDLGDFMPEMKGKKLQGRIEGKKFIPYAKRAEIEENGSFSHAKPFMWLKDPVDAFFLHIQGSGWVETDSGDVFHVSYAGNNGHPYTAIGKTLIEKGYMKREDVSLESLRTWLKENPQKREAIFNSNPRYIFFKEDKGQTVGSLNVPLIAERSLAVDPTFIPLGVPLFVSTTLSFDKKPFAKMMMAQDTGAAITGPVRGDIFFGDGVKAEQKAGVQNESGTLFVLLPKTKI